MLSPVCALAGKIDFTVFNMDDLTFSLRTELEDAAAGYSKLRALIDSVAHLHVTDLTAYYHLAGELDRCRRLVTHQYCMGRIYEYPDSKTIQAAAVDFEAAIEEIAIKKLEELPDHILEVIGRIQEARAARSVEAKEDGQGKQMQVMQDTEECTNRLICAAILERRTRLM